jgi:hypothetical protein
MTVPSQTSRSDYTGNGVATVFPYAFKITEDADLLVTTTSPAGVTATLVLGVDYTVQGAGQPTGSITLLTGPLPGDGIPANSYALAIQRSMVPIQDLDLRNQGPFLAELIESALDRIVMLIQQLWGSASRSLRLPASEAGSELLTVLPPLAERKGMAMGFDPTTGQPGAYTPLDGATVSAAMIPVVQAATTAAARAAIGQATEDNIEDSAVTTGKIADGAVTTDKIASLPFWGAILNSASIAISEAGSATANRMHVVTGTSADYTITLPVSPAAGTVVGFAVGNQAAASKQYKLDAGAGVVVAGRTRYLVLLFGNTALLLWDGAKWVPLTLDLDTPWIDDGAVTIKGFTSDPTKASTGLKGDIVRWRRSGQSLEQCVDYYQQNAGADGSGRYVFRLARGFTIDQTLVPMGGSQFLGNGVTVNQFGTIYDYPVSAKSSTFGADYVELLTVRPAGSGYVASGFAGLGSAGTAYYFRFNAPITNW